MTAKHHTHADALEAAVIDSVFETHEPPMSKSDAALVDIIAGLQAERDEALAQLAQIRDYRFATPKGQA